MAQEPGPVDGFAIWACSRRFLRIDSSPNSTLVSLEFFVF